MSSYEDLRRRQVADMVAAMPGYVARLDWSRAELERHRRRALRLLLRVAKEHSPWWRERLREVDPAAATEDDLERIPPMTRDDLMDHWDEILIYPSLRLAQVEAHLDEAKADAYLFDTFHAVRSGGACGRPGVLLYDWEGWIASYSGCARWRLRNRASAMGSRRPRVAQVASAHPAHISRRIHETFRLGEFRAFPAVLPLEEIVAGLQRLQPEVLIGYPSMLRELAKEAHAGRLDIRPAYVHCGGEPLDAALRRELSATFGSRVVDGWAASEAQPLAQACSVASRLHVNDDLVIVEPVDGEGLPVPPGTPSTRVYLTSLYNLALPLIRYELDDQVTVSRRPCACGSAYTALDTVGGPLDDRFVYPDGIVVAAGALEAVLGRERGVHDYQVVQTPGGAEVRLLCDRGTHLRAVAQRVASALAKGGVATPSVRVRRVQSLERGPAGKRRRFVARDGSPAP